MKKFYMTMVAMLCGAAAMAQTCTISAEDVTVVSGTTDTPSYVEVLLNESEPGALVSAASFRIQLPEGVSIYRYWNEDDEEWVDDITFPAAKSGHNLDIQTTTNANEYQLSAASNKAYFKTSTNVLAKIGVVATDVANGVHAVKISKISFSNTAGQSVYPQDDFTFKMTVGGTGINDIKALDNNAPIYNVAGQRVSKAQKGVYIQNGKKVAVK